VWDSAESIIDALLPDGEEDREDVVDCDHSLESDIETFEQINGKVIQPEDDLPDLVDEIQMEDIEQSH
jgi:hypothetical protein